MNTTTSLWVVAIIVGGVAVVWFCRVEAKRRWTTLAKEGLLAEIASIDPKDIRRVVVIDLGFGKETWLLRSGELTVDRKTRFVKDAVVLDPEASLPRELADRCEEVSMRF
jgi:hypothetical protein